MIFILLAIVTIIILLGWMFQFVPVSAVRRPNLRMPKMSRKTSTIIMIIITWILAVASYYLAKL